MGRFGTNLGQKSYKNYIIYAKYNQYKIYCYGLEMLIYCGFKWSGQRDSNPRHQAWEACTLPAELCPLFMYLRVIYLYHKNKKL